MLKKDTSSKILAWYAASKEWISTIEFYLDSFFTMKNIIDRYLDKILKNENLDEIRECVMRLQDIRYSCSEALEKVKLHKGVLVEFQDKKLQPIASLEKEHLRLKKIMGTCHKNFKEIKNEVFSITEHTLQISKEENLAIELEKIKVARNN